jgi:hypothetical protein
MDRLQLTQSKNPTSPTVSVRIHRRVESQDNIPDCTKTHIIKPALPISLPGLKITSIPIDFVLPKLLNYLAFQSFDLELPDEGYSRNVHVH